MRLVNKSAITIYKTDEFLNWIKTHHKNLKHWTLKELNHHPNIYLVDEEDQNCQGDCFEQHFKSIFQAEVGEYIYNGVEWPKNISFNEFRSWFRYEYSELDYNLSMNELEQHDE